MSRVLPQPVTPDAAAASDAVHPHRASSARRGDIQGLRALAVVLVVAYHADRSVPGGFIGVDIFFVISGYVITRMLLAEAQQTGRLDLRHFYLRRIRRILPALALMSSVVVLAGVVVGPAAGGERTASTGASASLLSANTYLMLLPPGDGYFDVSAGVNSLIHTWSLSVEEQFYLAFPAALLGALVLARRARALEAHRSIFVLLVVVLAVSFALCWTTSTGRTLPLVGEGLSTQFGFYASPARAWEFAAGSLLALAARRVAGLGPLTSGAAAVLGGALILWAAFAFDDTTTFPGTAAAIPVWGTMLLIAAGESRSGNPVSRALAVAPAQFVGDVSYGWYLWHLPLIVIATALVPHHPSIALLAAAASLAVAWASYRLIEDPVRHRRAAPGRTLAIGALCVLTPLLAVGAAQLLWRQLANVKEPPPLPLHLDVTAGCNDAAPLGEPTRPDCTWEAPGGGGEDLAALVGDSNAGQFSEPFIEAANDDGRDAVLATYASCPFVDLVVEERGDERPGCRGFVTGTLRDLVARRPSFVVIASASSWYIEDDDFTFTDPRTGLSRGDPAGKASMWRAGLARVLERLTAAGVDVVIVHPVPRFDGFDLTRCSTVWWLLDAGRCGSSITRAEAEAFRDRAVEAESAGAEDAGATTIDPLPQLCAASECRTHDGDTWLWRDMGHVSLAAAPRLTDALRTAMP